MKKTFILLSVLAGSLLSSTSFGQIIFQGLNPAPAQGFYNFTNPDWGADLLVPANAVTGFGVLVDDGTVGDSLGCNNLVNGAAVSGKIAFIYRGDCEFGAKALKAQQAGAIAAVIINNVPGTIAMGAGAQGANVTIPVVMISQESGVILRPYLNAGTLEVFIGSKLGLFANDLGIEARDIIRPLNYATPSLLAQTSADFQVLMGANVRNFGNLAQTNATLSAKIMLNGTTEVYNESASVASIPAMDSSFITLPAFDLPNGNVAKYTITYTLSGDATDEATGDNIQTQDFYITDGPYSKSRYDIAAGKPIRTSGLTAAATAPEVAHIKWGVLMNAVSGSSVKVKAIQFSAVTNTPDVLTGEIVTGYLYEWDDANQDGGISDDEIQPLAVGFYSYESDLQAEYVDIVFDDEPALADDKVYFIAVEYEGTKTVFFSVDEAMDYEQTINNYGQSINPLNNLNDGAWFGGGFGSEYALAIGVKTAFNNVSVEETELDLKLSVYPNPATNVVNITFGNAVANADVKVDVVDVTGRIVMNRQFNIGNAENFVSVNTADLASGSYFFKVSVNNQVVKSLPVVISK